MTETSRRSDQEGLTGDGPRPYVQRARAQRTAETTDRILDSAERLFGNDLFDRVSLESIAREADVSIPTLLRRYRSKEGIFRAAAARAQARVAAQRAAPVRGNIAANLDQLIAHYEQDGRMVWHLLRQEQDSPLVADVLRSGRSLHRRWVEGAFGEGSRERTDALVAATDVFIWKLLRIDLGRSARSVNAVMRQLVDGVLAGGKS
jgi:AcrR family transcriptional regulator